MTFVFKAAGTVCSLLFAASAFAAPVSLGSIEHLYGSDPGRQLPSINSLFHPGGQCDTPNATTLTVKATSAASCNRFGDIFDFSAIDYLSIDHFTVTLVFAGARDQVAGLERWNVRASSSYVQTAVNFGAQLNASGTQSFDFPNSASTFNSILGTEQFMLAFATNSGASSRFDLSSAKVEIFGTAAISAVPEPSSIALVGLSLAALVGVRRAKGASKSLS